MPLEICKVCTNSLAYAFTIQEALLNDGACFHVRFEPPIAGAPYSYEFFGSNYGKPFRIHMLRQGLKELLKEGIKAL